MKKFFNIVLALSLVAALSCSKENGGSAGGGSSTEGYFFKNAFAYNLSNNATVQIPIVRLGNSGDLEVSITSDAPAIFSLPPSVTIKDGERAAMIDVTYNMADVEYNTEYVINVQVKDFASKFGYKDAVVTIERPTSFYKYASGTIVEDWWGEQEDKDMYARDYGSGILQCYLPQCWGHDTGPGYPVQDYVWFWDTKTNLVYVPFQPMGNDDWMIADRGAVACMFGGPNYKAGSADWRAWIDKWYTDNGLKHPYYNPETKSFYLSDTAALDPKTGAVTYGKAGSFDVFTIAD